MPPTVDEAVSGASWEAPEQTGAQRFRWLPLMPWAVAAGTALLVALLAYRFTPGGTVPGHSSAFAREDLNRDGQVDILDAFVLAKLLKSGARPASGLDINGDGVVDEHGTSRPSRPGQ